MTYRHRFTSLLFLAPLLVSIAACGGGTSGTTSTEGTTSSTGATTSTAATTSGTTGSGGATTSSTSGTTGSGGASSSTSGTTGSGGATTSSTSTGGGSMCGSTTCKAGEICLAKSGGAIMEPKCVADPCAPQPLSCTCADTLCGGSVFVCSVAGQTVHCDCNTCP